MIEKVDRRFKRTQKLLMDALIALAQRDGYDAVTIRDITGFADISYSTFFRHYDDKDELLMSILKNAIEEMRELMQNQTTPEADGRLIFQHVLDNQSLYRVLLGGLNSSAMVQKVQDMIIQEIMTNQTGFSLGTIPADVAANHIAASALAMVKWWLDHDMPYPPEQMGSIYAALIIQPVKPR